MRIFVAVTDNDWFGLHRSSGKSDEVNFWRPSPDASFKALQAGELLLFKLHAPENFIAGGGFFTRFLKLSVDLAWDTFKEGNGVKSLAEMRSRIAHYRRLPIRPDENPAIGCVMLAEPFFWPREAWIPCPSDFSLNTVQGKGYDSEEGTGRSLWEAVVDRLETFEAPKLEPGTAIVAALDSKGYGKPQIVLPRLGQGLFRILLSDTYGWRCALTGEKTLPVLDAAHIKPYSIAQRHELSNGLIMRSDLHRLFDAGYVSVEPSRAKDFSKFSDQGEFDNGIEYYKLHGRTIREPRDPLARPGSENLEFHARLIFK